MTAAALLYHPRHRWRVVVAFGAAALLHLAAIALANVHGGEENSRPPLAEDFPDVIFEDPPSTMVTPPPEDPEPLPTHPRADETFVEDRSTPPPIRRQTSRPITPIVRPIRNALAGARTWSAAKVLAVDAPRPEYPYEARRQKITGNGIVTMTIDPGTGAVSGVSMSKSTGSPFLDNAALTGFRRWRFKPGTVSSVTCPVTFTLTGASY